MPWSCRIFRFNLSSEFIASLTSSFFFGLNLYLNPLWDAGRLLLLWMHSSDVIDLDDFNLSIDFKLIYFVFEFINVLDV